MPQKYVHSGYRPTSLCVAVSRGPAVCLRHHYP